VVAPLVGRPAVELAAAVRAGEVSAVDVVAAHLDQVAAVEHRLNAYAHVRGSDALADAAAIDDHPDRASLPLAGVPVAIKDNVAVAGLPTRHGSLATSDAPAATDHEVVTNWRAAGAVVLGITRCPELSLWGTTDGPEGPTVSPWEPTKTAGGSSGGSAAAVAAGTVPLALGSDELGSIRIPACANGLVGIKPGAGMLLETLPDGRPHWFGMSRFGPVATTVADAGLGLATMADRADLAAISPPERRLQVAVSVAPPAPGVMVGRPWVETTIEAGRLLRHAGHEVVRADPPYEPATILAVLVRWAQAAAVDLDDLVVDADRLQPRTRGHAAAGRRLARRFPVADEQARRWRDRVAPFLAEHDVLVTPMFARCQPASRDWHRLGWLPNLLANLTAYPFTAVWNLADVPAASVPLGSDRGRPLGVQVVGRPGAEATVLAVAAELERLVPWRRHPKGWSVPKAS
jgi:amidase